MIKIRNEQPSDYRLVEEITREAFWDLYVPGCNEHLIVHNIRKSKDFIPELTFVIEYDGKVCGSIFYTHSKVITDNGNEAGIITFGPVSILPELHRKGLGSALITHSIETAKKMGCRAVIIGGYPGYYKKFGFQGTKKYGISLPDGKYYIGIMALPLYDGALDGINGKLYFSTALETDNKELEAFDKTFPFKEKHIMASQKEFETTSAELDTNIYG